jgi:hypothetical protein
VRRHALPRQQLAGHGQRRHSECMEHDAAGCPPAGTHRHAPSTRLQAWGLTDEQLSCLFSLVVEAHTASVGRRLTIERSFDLFKHSLLAHSVQRWGLAQPPRANPTPPPGSKAAPRPWSCHGARPPCQVGRQPHHSSPAERRRQRRPTRLPAAPRAPCATHHTLSACTVCRPPYSLGVFNQEQMQAILEWMLASYYQHYKLYQYAFTSRWEGSHGMSGGGGRWSVGAWLVGAAALQAVAVRLHPAGGGQVVAHGGGRPAGRPVTLQATHPCRQAACLTLHPPNTHPCRVTMSFSTYHATSLIETVPQLPPLAEAITEAEYLQRLDEKERQVCVGFLVALGGCPGAQQRPRALPGVPCAVLAATHCLCFDSTLLLSCPAAPSRGG